MVLKKTIVEKILSKKSGRDVFAGEIVETEVDVLMGHDPLIAMIVNDFENLSGKIWDKDKLIFVADHFAPPCSLDWAGVLKKFLDFTKKQDIKNFYMFSGICHQLLAEHPNVAPGKVVVGTDSHTVMLGALNCLATGMGSTDDHVSVCGSSLMCRLFITFLTICAQYTRQLGEMSSPKRGIMGGKMGPTVIRGPWLAEPRPIFCGRSTCCRCS